MLDRRDFLKTAAASAVALALPVAARAKIEDVFVARLIEKHHVPGVSLAVIHGADVEAFGWGLLKSSDGRAAVTSRTKFQAASISKTVNALLVMTLVRDGLLSLDDPVNDRLRSWKLPGKAAKVTARRLLSHTGGVGVHGFGGYEYADTLPTLIETLDGAGPANNGPIRLATPIGRYAYSGGGIMVLQQLVIDATERPFVELAKERVLDPLGMADSDFNQPPADDDALIVAKGHRDDGSAIFGGFHVYPELAAAGLWTTPTDIARAIGSIVDSAKGAPGALLPETLARQMVTPVAGDAALGLFVDSRGCYNHDGSNYGYRCLYEINPRNGRGMVVMTNGENGDAVVGAVRKQAEAVYGL